MNKQPNERISNSEHKEQSHSMPKFKDYVIPSGFKFPQSKRRSLRDVNTSPTQFKKSNGVPPVLKLSQTGVNALQSCENSELKTESSINSELNRKFLERSTSPDLDSSSIVQPTCLQSNARKSPDLDNTSIVPATSALNNSLSRINARKSPDLDFSNITMPSLGQKCAINLINEVTGLLTPPSAKSCAANLSPDLNYKHKDYSKMDLFTNSITLNLSQSSELSQPKSCKLIITDLCASPDLSCKKHIKSTSADVCLTDASNSNDSPDVFSISMSGNEEAIVANSPNLSQQSCIQSSQYYADSRNNVSPSSQSNFLFSNSLTKTLSTPKTFKLLTDLSYKESPCFSSKKRLFQDESSFTSLSNKKSKPSILCPRDGKSCKCCVLC